MEALTTYTQQLWHQFSWIRRLDAVTLDGRHCWPRHAALIAQAGCSYVLTLTDEQQERLRAAEACLNLLWCPQ